MSINLAVVFISNAQQYRLLDGVDLVLALNMIVVVVLTLLRIKKKWK